MQAHYSEGRYVRMAVFVLLSLAFLASLIGFAEHWFSHVHRPLDMVIPPAMSVLFAVLIVALARRPAWTAGIVQVALVASSLSLIAPAWVYTLQALHDPGVELIRILPPVPSLLVALLVMVMIFVPLRRSIWMAALVWVLVALPVLLYLFGHPHQLETPRGRDLVMAYGPVSLLVVTLMPLQRGLAGTIQRLSSERDMMELLLHRDPQTGVQSRRFGQRMLRKLVDVRARTGVIMLDLDRFKSINDTYGHPEGDRVLQVVADCCKQLLHGGEWISRWGGEEFLVIAPETEAGDLRNLALRLQSAIERLDIHPVSQVTASFGVTMMRDTDSLSSLLQRADKAMYKAKGQGGNVVVAALEDEDV